MGAKPVWLWLWITPATGGASPASAGIPERAPVIVGTVAASPTICIIRATKRTPPAIVMARRAVWRNPPASPPAPVTGHRPIPTAATPHFDSAWYWNELPRIRLRLSCTPRYRSGQSKHPGHDQSENAHLWVSSRLSALRCPTKTVRRRLLSRAFGFVCCHNQMGSLLRPPCHTWRPLPRSRFTSRAPLVQLPPHNPFDLNLGFVMAGLRQIVGHLQPQPRFRATTERFVEADRHLRRNTALGVHKVVEGLPCYTQNVRSLTNRQTKGFDAVMPDRKPRMGRVFHPHGLAPRFSDTRLNRRRWCSLGQTGR